ncbi:hypothetical protein [Streptomyces sp. BE230]|nr:hypothetical protein [Streptomyces sp. BE230]
MGLGVLGAGGGAVPFAKPRTGGTYDEVVVAGRTLRSDTVHVVTLFGKVC